MDPVKRLNYFNGLFLVEDDFRLEQNYHIRARRLMNRLFNQEKGVLEGLEVKFEDDSKKITVAPGVGVVWDLDDTLSREVAKEIILVNLISYTILPADEGEKFLILSYKEDKGPRKDPEDKEHYLTFETPALSLVSSVSSNQLKLAKVKIQGGKVVTPDLNDRDKVRKAVRSVFGDMADEKGDLKIKRKSLIDEINKIGGASTEKIGLEVLNGRVVTEERLTQALGGINSTMGRELIINSINTNVNAKISWKAIDDEIVTNTELMASMAEFNAKLTAQLKGLEEIQKTLVEKMPEAYFRRVINASKSHGVDEVLHNDFVFKETNVELAKKSVYDMKFFGIINSQQSATISIFGGSLFGSTVSIGPGNNKVELSIVINPSAAFELKIMCKFNGVPAGTTPPPKASIVTADFSVLRVPLKEQVLMFHHIIQPFEFRRVVIPR